MNNINFNRNLLEVALLDPNLGDERVLKNRIQKLNQEDRNDLVSGLNEIEKIILNFKFQDLITLEKALKELPERALCVILLTDDGNVIGARYGEDACKAWGEKLGVWISSETVISLIHVVRNALIAKGASRASFSCDAMISCLFEHLRNEQPLIEDKMIHKRLNIAERNRRSIGHLNQIRICKEKTEGHQTRVAALAKAEKCIDTVLDGLNKCSGHFTFDKHHKLVFILSEKRYYFNFDEYKLDEFVLCLNHVHCISNYNKCMSIRDSFPTTVGAMKNLLGDFDKYPEEIKQKLNEVFESRKLNYPDPLEGIHLIKCYLTAVGGKFKFERMKLEEEIIELQKSIEEITKIRTALLNSELNLLDFSSLEFGKNPLQVEQVQMSPLPPNPPKQRIVVKYDAGFGNWICITGDSPDMNTWGARIPLIKDPSDNDTWFYEVPEGAPKFDYKFTLHKKGASGFEWETKNGNHKYDPIQKGQQVHVVTFPKK